MLKRRRPKGYVGPDHLVLQWLEDDARAALAAAKEFYQRARRGEDVTAGVMRETFESALRAEACARLAGRGHPAILRTIVLDQQSEILRTAAMFPNADLDAHAWYDEDPPRAAPPARRSTKQERAAAFIAAHAGAPKVSARRILADATAARDAYRRAAKALHPDAGGDTALMQELTEAWGSLGGRGVRRGHEA